MPGPAAQGLLGEDTTRLLGSFVLARAWQAATHRARTGQADRRTLPCTSTNARTSCTLPHGLEDMLAEARAYAVCLCLVHQNLAQLGRELREGISANARNKIIFTVLPEDARDLERHVMPGLSAHDLSHLGAFQAAARLVAGPTSSPRSPCAPCPCRPPIPGRADGDPRRRPRRRRRPPDQPAAGHARRAPHPRRPAAAPPEDTP